VPPLLLLLLRSRCCVVADAGDKSKSKLDGLLALTGVRLEAVQRPWVSMPAEDRAAVMRKLKAFSIAATVASSPGALRVRAVLSCGRAGEGASWRVEAGIWSPNSPDNRVSGVGAGVLHLTSRCDFVLCVKWCRSIGCGCPRQDGLPLRYFLPLCYCLPLCYYLLLCRSLPAGGAVSDAEIGWDVSGAAALEESTAMMVTDRFDLSPQMFYRSFTYTVGASVRALLPPCGSFRGGYRVCPGRPCQRALYR